jgi:hypothetical protein
MKVLLVVAVLALALSASASAGTTAQAPSGKAATAALGRYLHHRYGGVQGYWECPAAVKAMAPSGGPAVGCEAEVRARKTWHMVTTLAYLQHGRIAFNLDPRHSFTSWHRQWSPYTHQVLKWPGSHLRGTASVNTHAYDWGFIARCAANTHPGQAHHCLGADWTEAGHFRIYHFTCSAQTSLITCANPLGDAMHYRR